MEDHPHTTPTQDGSDQSADQFHWPNASSPRHDAGDPTVRYYPNQHHRSWPATHGFNQPYYLYPTPYDSNVSWQYVHYPQTPLVQQNFQSGLFPTHANAMGVSAGVGYGDQPLIQQSSGTRRQSRTYSISQPLPLRSLPHHASTQSIQNVAQSTFGPPRRPRQSGYALWVGNLPPRVSIVDLKDYFSSHFTTDIESLKLIRKTNCAFVNYRTVTACAAAADRFHESAFQGRQLVCRQRKTEPSGLYPQSSHGLSSSESLTSTSNLTTMSQLGPSQPYLHLPARYIILKSLTSRDLTLSTQTSAWITQPHNEPVLNAAFDACDILYLIFSANKSGEFFGVATMVAKIPPLPEAAAASKSNSDADMATSSQFSLVSTLQETLANSGAARITVTDATEWAPKGMIYEDVARGVIYWEATIDEEQSSRNGAATVSATDTTGGSTTDNTEGATQPTSAGAESRLNSPVIARDGISSPIVSSSNVDDSSTARIPTSAVNEEETDGCSASNNTASPRSFKVQWLSTKRVLFHRSRGLRNAWNDGKEVKVARDGTEVETEVGKKLVELFW